jgi:succinate--hydroxymethylglutarate CoA-transferase
VKHREVLYRILDAEVVKHQTDKLIAELEAAKVPCAPVNSMQQVFSHRQVKHRGMQQTLRHPAYGDVASLGAAAKYSGFEVTAGWTAPPLLGEDTDAVLREWLALSDDELAKLRATKVI